MSVRFPAVTSLEVIQVLEKIGFRFKRQSGSSHPLSLCSCLSDIIGFQHPLPKKLAEIAVSRIKYLMFEISYMQERIRKGEYYFSKHGDQERQNDNLTIAEVARSEQ